MSDPVKWTLRLFRDALPPPSDAPLTVLEMRKAIGFAIDNIDPETMDCGSTKGLKLNIDELKTRVRELLNSSRTRPPAIFAIEAKKFLDDLALVLEVKT